MPTGSFDANIVANDEGGKLARWLKSEGDSVVLMAIGEIETDKATMEIEWGC